MLGYVLLTIIAIFMSTAVYLWIKLYVPSEIPECSDGVSLFLEEVKCQSGSKLNVTVKNNGLFSVAGYYIYITNNSNQKIADKDLSPNITSGGISAEGFIRFTYAINNSLVPGNPQQSIFLISGNVARIQIIPVRYEEVNNKLYPVSCGNSKIEEKNINCT